VPRVELFGSPGLLDDTVGEFDWRRGVWRDWVYGRPCPPALMHERDVPMASLCCLLAPSSLFRHAGMLDERLFMYYEDFDFLRRAQSAGYRIRYVPEAVVYHRKSAASGGGDSPFKVYYATRNRVAVMRRHSGRARFAIFTADFALTRLARMGQYLIRGRPAPALAMLRGWCDAYRGRMGRTFPAPEPT
jgi:GT2 family glycosyltransferase